MLAGTFNFNAGAQVTVTLVGLLETNTAAFGWFFEDYTQVPQPEMVSVTVYHAIPGAGAVDIYADGELILEDAAYPNRNNALSGARNITVPSGQYDLLITAANDIETELLSIDGVDLLEGSFYVIAAIGTPEEPDVVVIRTATDG